MNALRFTVGIFACFSLVSCASKSDGGSSHPDRAGPPGDSGAGDAAQSPAPRGDASSSNTTNPPPKADAGPLCKDDPGPTATAGGGRPVLPWSLSFDAGAAADAGTDAGRTSVTEAGPDSGSTTASDAGRTTPSGEGCQMTKSTNIITGGSDLQCRGSAVTRRTGSDLVLQFADGSTLQWAPDSVRSQVAAPDVQDGDRVWVEYRKSTSVVCPFCGDRTTTDLQIRREQGGQILWMGREGSHDTDVDASLVRELFGVDAHTMFACSAPGLRGGCFTTDRRIYDHVLATAPEQTVAHATLTHVVTPGGAYDVFWTHTEDTVKLDTMCYDGPEPSADNSFAVSRTPN